MRNRNVLRKLLEVFFNLLYHQFAWSYDAVSWIVSFGQWKSWVRSPMPHLKSGKLLELGFGPGHLQLASQQNERVVIGLDPSPQMGKIASRRLRREGFQTNLTRGDARQIPFQSNSIDQIVATFPSEYFLEPQTLMEVHRVLAPGGELILLPMAWIRGKKPIHMILAWLFKITGQSVEKAHPHFTNGLALIEKVGFTVRTEIIDFTYSETLLIFAKKV